MNDGSTIPPPLTDDVVVWVAMRSGARLESPLMPGVIADTDRLTIRMRRDQRLNHERRGIPSWLPDGFDFSEVADVGVECRDPA